MCVHIDLYVCVSVCVCVCVYVVVDIYVNVIDVVMYKNNSYSK